MLNHTPSSPTTETRRRCCSRIYNILNSQPGTGVHVLTLAKISPPLLTRVSGKKGFYKVREATLLARKQGFNFIWIDTCCIDTSSNTEPSKAISSMYQWYKDAQICYAFLADVRSVTEEDPSEETFDFSGKPVIYAALDIARADCPP
ncbi:hypothetical protein QC761_0083620 [Podospora bellae-mahoneyi]|uniref:Heterokaryon incompatibility domain-containing protein n=1 Tax=Podospora bellae-mahoneyi TaxID=2093777 RepID=A0ABR0FEE8_9PEZI|nr:hypothetical protein QC761_0083620 [Podospora bellae-mahoneyi]